MDAKFFTMYFRNLVEMSIITNDQWWKNFVSNCSISKVLHIQILLRLSPWRKPIETEGESHSTVTSRQVQVLRKHGKCIYRGNDVWHLARSLCFSSHRCVDSRSSSSGRSSFTDSGGYLNVGGCFRCCPSSCVFYELSHCASVKYGNYLQLLCTVKQ